MNSRFHRACLRLADLLVRHPRLVTGALFASAAVSLVLLPRLAFDFTPQAIYRGNDNLVEYAEQFKQTFGYDEAVVMIVLEATGSRDVLDAPALEWQAVVATGLQALPEVARVESLATLEVPRLVLTDVELRPVLRRLPVDEDAAEQARSLLVDQPLVRHGLLSEDDRVASMPVFLDPSGRDIVTMRQTVAAIEETVAGHALPEGYRVHFSGLPVLRVEVVDNLRADLMRLIPLAGIVYLTVLGLLFRRAWAAILPMTGVAIGLAWTLAVFVALHESLNLISNVLPVLMVIIGVSSSVQIISCYAEHWENGRHDLCTAARGAIAHMAPASLLAAITTAIGFASLCTARSVLLGRFGWQAAIGVGLQYVSTLVTLGALMRYFTPPKIAAADEVSPGFLTRVASGAGYTVARHPHWTLIGAALVVAGSIWAAGRVRIDSYAIIETFRAQDPAVITLRLVEEKLSGIIPLEISLEADTKGRFLEPETFHKVAAVEAAAKKLPGVLTVESYTDMFREVLSHWPGRRQSESDVELAPLDEAGRTRLARTDRFIQQFADAFHYHAYLDAEGGRARIRMRLGEIGSQATLRVIAELETALAETFPPGSGIVPRVTGEGYVSARALTTLIRDLYWSLFTASLVIFGLIAIEFRSLRVGLIAALPNLTPLAVTLGYMGLRGYDMNVGNVIVFTICLGLADDNTIHFLYRFREEYQGHGDVALAVRRAFRGTGRAIVATSMLLLVGMIVLMFSSFVPTQRFGELTAVTIVGNLIGVLLLLPACLVLFWKRSAASVVPAPHPQTLSAISHE